MSLLIPMLEAIAVMDASVIAKYMLPDEAADDVERIISQDTDFIAPSIIEFEIRSLLCKHVRLGRMTKEMADEISASWAKAVEDEWIWIAPRQEYVDNAFTLATEIKHAFYDCCYLAVARHYDAPLVTADRQLYERGKTIYSNILLVSQDN